MKRFFTNTISALVFAAVLAACAFTPSSFAQGPPNLPPTWVYARAYAAWNVAGQQANTFTFNGGPGSPCYSTALSNGYTSPFFVFSGVINASTVYNPVAILDANPALSEIVTPTSTTANSSSTCGFAASPANSHISFNLVSGTAGLQEAIEYQLQSTPSFVVVLDKYWYQLVAGLPSGTPQSIIGTVTGDAYVYIVDTTTAPWQFYYWNGSKYVPVALNGGVQFTSLTALAVPVAPTTVAATCATNLGGCITTATTGGTIPASGAYTVGYTYVNALGGETTQSIDTASGATVTVGATATNTITVTSPPAETGAVGWRLYLTAASGATGTEILYASSCATPSNLQIVLNGVCAIGSSATVTAIITGTAAAPTLPSVGGTYPAPNTAFPVVGGTTSPLENLVSYPPFTNVATISAGATGNLGYVNFATGFLNTLGRHIHVHGTGFGTTNSTTGTLTVATPLYSVAGVTSVTPFTAVSGTTTGSAVVNFTFDIDYTTLVTGSSGKVEAHGTVCYNLAGTAVCTPAQDLLATDSSAIDLTKQDQLAVTLKPTTTAITTGGAQLRQLTVQVLQ